MLNVALDLVTAMDDDGQAVFSTQPVIGPEHLVVVTFIGMVVRVVDETDHIENQILVNISLVNMRAKYKLILATQYFFCQLHLDFMSFLSGSHSMLKGVDLVALVEQLRQSLERQIPWLRCSRLEVKPKNPISTATIFLSRDVETVLFFFAGYNIAAHKILLVSNKR